MSQLMGGAERGGQVSGGFGRSLTTFVGRQAELQRLRSMLDRHRLITITGPGGVGKTRLAAEATHSLQARFPDGVRLAELAAISDPVQVPWAVAACVGARDDAAQPILQAIAAVLSREQSLLILDNCEQVAVAVAEFCQTMLSASDEVQILATSREPLRVGGEAQLRLAPLTTARPDAARPDDADGVALFLDRVRLRDPTLELTPELGHQIAEIVAKVDGLPLAIELAAARAEALGLTQLLERLDEPLLVLTGGAATTARRHRSLWATADWSYQLLDELSRQVFRRLAILPGPFTLQAATAIAGARAEPAVLSLVEASILTPPSESADGRTRYRMLESLRAYGREQLDSCGEQEDALSALASYALEVGDEAASLMRTSGGEVRAADRFDAESALLHGALLWMLDGDDSRALQLGVALAPWWRLRGLGSMGYPLLSRAATAPPAGRDTAQRAAQKWLGLLAQGSAAWQTALQHFTTLHDAVDVAPMTTELVDALVGRSTALRNLGHLQAATGDALRALDLARELAYVEGEALAVTQLALAASYADDASTAMTWNRQLRQVDRTCIPDKVGRMLDLVDTFVLADAADLDGAWRACAAGLSSAREAGDVAGQADFLYFTTHIALRSGNLAEASAQIRESLRLTARSGHRLRVLDCLDDGAYLCAATGRAAEAIRLWAARAAQTAALGMSEPPQDTRRRQGLLDQARQRIGAAAAADAERRGAAMTLDTAAEFVGIMAAAAPSRTSQTSTGSELTPRERELLTLVAQGQTDAQIAEALFISIRTVRSHLDRIRDKSGSRRRADLTRLALRHGLV